MNKWWWLTWNATALSIEERRAAVRLLLTGICLFIAICVPLLRWFHNQLNSELGVLAVSVAAVLAFGAARTICSQIWPEVIKKGDEKAAIRLAKRKRPQ